MPKYDNNLLVVGAGSAGLIAALIGATVRARVTLIERDAMGGDCLTTGCVPSKTLIASAKAAHALRVGERYGLTDVTGFVDFDAVMQRVHEAIAAIAPKDSVERYTSLGVNCVLGNADVIDGHTVAVDGKHITARRMVLATGAAPIVPPIPGLDRIDVLTSETLWSLDALPPRLLVLGGGPIGCELAQAFARLGSDVTVMDMEDRLLPREDPAASALIEQTFVAEGIEVLTGHRALEARPGLLVAQCVGGVGGVGGVGERNGARIEVAFDRILVAVGRRARHADLVDLNPDGTIAVDDALRTSIPTIYACGDAVGPYQFTHMAGHQAWYAAVNALAAPFWRFKANYAVVPWATYTDPEVARVGITEADAPAGSEVTIYPIDDLDRAIAEGRTDGFVKIISKGNRVLGATIVAVHAGELISEFVTAMTHGIGLKQMLATIHVYPTLMEANKLAAGAWRRAGAPQGLLRFAERLFAAVR